MERVDLKLIIETCKESDAKIDFEQLIDVMMGSISYLYNDGTILKRVERKIGQEDWNILITSVLSTFLSSLYATVELKDNTEKAAEFGKEIGAKEMAVVKDNKKYN